MFAGVRRSGRLLVIGAVAAIALAACSGNSPTPTPAPTPTPTQPPTATPIATDTPVATPTAAVATGCDLNAAGAAFSKLDSYQFKMVLGGAAADNALGDLQLDPAPAYTLTGTIVHNPASGTDITIDPSKFHVIEVGGFDYFDADGNGSFTQVGPDQGGSGDTSSPADTSLPTDAAATPQTGGNLAAPFSPETIFGTSVEGSATYTLSGTETKDDVQALHCTTSPTSLEAFGSTLGIADATWTADVWIAQTGGYPVSVALVARAKDNTIPFEILLDLSKVNDASNSVKAPTNISGA